VSPTKEGRPGKSGPRHGRERDEHSVRRAGRVVVIDPTDPTTVVPAFINALRHIGGAATVDELRSIVAQDYPWRRAATEARMAAAIVHGSRAGLIGAAWRDDGELVVFIAEREGLAS
jgi:hypothetical protein